MQPPLWLGLRNRAALAVARATIRPDEQVDLVRAGSSYGGWWIPPRLLAPGVVAYCVGAGEDITFDRALHDAGCTVRTFDPTPRAIAHVEKEAPRSDRFTFRPIGLWSSDTEIRFYAPRVPGHVSHSAVNLYGTDNYFVAPVRTLRSLMRESGDEHIDLLKMDVEGAEVAIIDALAEDRAPTPSVLCVEFDQPQPLRNIRRSIGQLHSLAYRLVKVDGWNYTFVH